MSSVHGFGAWLPGDLGGFEPGRLYHLAWRDGQELVAIALHNYCDRLELLCIASNGKGLFPVQLKEFSYWKYYDDRPEPSAITVTRIEPKDLPLFVGMEFKRQEFLDLLKEA